MKNISLILNGVLLAAVAVLYYLHFSSGPVEVSTVPATTSDLKVAYVNSDSLLQNYEYFKTNRTKLEAKQKKLEQDMRNRAQSLQNDFDAYQRNRGNLTIGQANAIEQDLGNKQQNLEMYRQSLGQEMMADDARAVAACDVQDGVTDGVLDDPRSCKYNAVEDRSITKADCAASDGTCLTPTEASAIDKMWQGPVACSGRDGGACKVPDVAARDLDARGDKRLWYGNTRGTDLTALGGAMPFMTAIEQPRYWVYFDPSWDWTTLDYASYPRFFADTVAKVGPLLASDNPNLKPFRDSGGKLVLWHGWSDQLIVPTGTVDYYERVANELGGYERTREFARLFMAPGVAHCAGGDGPQPQGAFQAVVDWVEAGKAPDTILASKALPAGTRTRPLCAYPAQARWNGRGSTDDAANFVCVERNR